MNNFSLRYMLKKKIVQDVMRNFHLGTCLKKIVGTRCNK